MRRLRISILILMLVAIAGFVAVDRRPGLTRSNFDRIEAGMTLAEVERLLGGPPTMRPFTLEQISQKLGKHDDHVWLAGIWASPDGQKYIKVDANLEGKVFSASCNLPPGRIERVIDWIAARVR